MIIDPNDYTGCEYELSGSVDYIAIGTCDWDTFSMSKPELKGIIIEPIALYLENIPVNLNVT